MDLESLIEAAARRGAEEALAAHRPRRAWSYDEAALQLGCSHRSISKLVSAGHLELVPHTRSITEGSLRRLVGLDELPVSGPRLVADDDLEAVG